MCVCIKQSADPCFVRRSKRTLTAPTIVSLSFSLSLRFNLNAQICNGYNGKRGFCWCKKREKRTTFLCEKETRLQLESFQSKRSERFLSRSLSFSLSLITFSLSLCYCIRLNREHDVQWKLTPSTSASIHALLASSHRRRNNMEEEEEETLTETRTRTTIESLERDVEVRRLATFSLSFELENAFSLSLARSLF